MTRYRMETYWCPSYPDHVQIGDGLCDKCQSRPVPVYGPPLESVIDALRVRLIKSFEKWARHGMGGSDAKKIREEAEQIVWSELNLTEREYRTLGIIERIAAELESSGKYDRTYRSGSGGSIRAVSGGMFSNGRRA